MGEANDHPALWLGPIRETPFHLQVVLGVSLPGDVGLKIHLVRICFIIYLPGKTGLLIPTLACKNPRSKTQ